ncbi:methyl-accepting chemotaxis protein [Neptuniibacter sp. 2_MG-2023]|uniref:methyl-accepting chemotaxis protein n=1 Tax=Neptuniibacter sp. 2_MG-2023 TaxID=3062671 RepID=UPI0026E1861A|nr:HAMP domain-containing methyl-accepting chemotaxis protein [Neptuniibacter sp. 2_MG-2023]MDO6513291.1 HAMP domain-containing methyl-accepting chemotaxis protein [Neptuniibacter sp. 2_MG-2023]
MNRFKQMSISLRITLGYMVMMCLLAMLGFSSVFNISKLASALQFVSGPALQASNGGSDTAFSLQAEVLKTQQILLKQIDPKKGFAEIKELHKAGQKGFSQVLESGLVDQSLLKLSAQQMDDYKSLNERALSLYIRVEKERSDLTKLTDIVLENVMVSQEDTMILIDEHYNSRLEAERYRDLDLLLSEVKTLILSRNYVLQQFFNGVEIEKQRKVMAEQYRLLEPTYQRLLVMLRNLALTEHAVNIETSLGKLLQQYEQVVNDYLVFKKVQDSSFNKAQALLSNLSKIKDQGEEKILENTHSVVSLVEQAKEFILVVVVIGLLVGVIAMLFGYRTVVKPLDAIADNLDKIGRGDGNLNVKLSEKGAKELRKLSIGFNVFVNKIKHTVIGVNDAAKNLCSQTDKLVVISDTTRTVINEQTTDTELVVEAIDQLAISTSEIAESAAHAADAAKDADAFLESGKHEVYAMIQAIRSQVEQLNNTNAVMDKLSHDSKRIGDVLSVINDIAEQTNLLALNAAIEAARAGEKGRGFAVVADEVRTLASNTQQATTTIQNVIKELQSASKEADSSVVYTLKIAEQGVIQAEKADDILKKITEAIGTINSVNIQVAAATQQQAVITQSIKENIYSVSGKSIKTSESFDEINESIEVIIAVVDGLNDGIKQFKLS